MFHPRLRRLLLLLGILVVCSAGLWLQHRRRVLASHKPVTSASLIPAEVLAQFTAIEERERQADESAWPLERRAEQCGAVFDALWDEVNRATNRFNVLASFPMGQIELSSFGPPHAAVNGIELLDPSEPRTSWRQSEWQDFLTRIERDGWGLDSIEFRQRGYDPPQDGQPERSRFSFRADTTNAHTNARATLEGEIAVDWSSDSARRELSVRRIDARKVTIRRVRGDPVFKPILSETIVPQQNWLFIDPLILYDLDGDGLSEIILAGKNLVYRRQPQGQYQPQSLCKYEPGRIFTAIVADFNGDGFADFLCAKAEGLFLFPGSSHGTFEDPPQLVWAAQPLLKYAQVLTCADIDGDGDLDLFLGQYKSPYFHGQMPTPYYDANDGDPAYLLLNDGQGHFTDITQSSGLATKRWRRSYSGSFVRLADQTNFDLVVVSDFAGVDLYRNDGHGHFTDITKASFPDSMGFGMAHALADFNTDGRLDLLMIGMASPTVDRLDHLKLRRPEAREDPAIRDRLACGNRLFLAQPGGRFEPAALSPSVASSGWSWGCTAFDLNNDNFPDLYVANGHESRASVQEYEAEFWLHDIYVAGSTNDLASDLYFQSKFTRTRGRGQSYGGYQRNRLYLNLEANSFMEAGYLMGVGLAEDCRNAVADDLDGDGRMDLLVTTFEVWPTPKQTLRVYQNTFASPGNWIGFRFREQGKGRSPVGCSVTIHYGPHAATSQIVTGDSYRCQRASTLHFGLGPATQVDWAEIVYANGVKTRLTRPELNKYHVVDQNLR